MAKVAKAKKEEKTVTKATETAKEAKVAKKIKADFTGMSVREAKVELQKLALKIKTGEEKTTSKLKALKKYIAKELTKANLIK